MEKRIGIYIHIPFCASKCAYCDFYSLAGAEVFMNRYRDAVIKNIREWESQLDGYLIDTVYFGGGTPSYFGAERLTAILDSIKKYGNLLKQSEVTFEANPDSVTPSGLTQLRKAGFNRISLGVQSANDGLLKSLGRRHDFAQAVKAVEDARKAGFFNVSLDLIYGLPSQTKDEWADTLYKAASLKPEHFSCYGLKIEPGTRLYEYKDSPFIPDDDAQADMYLYTVETLERLGYRQYEVSNFAKHGFQSEHNMKYWLGMEYIGFGAAAHSYIGGSRYSCIADVEKYCERIENGGSIIEGLEPINDFEHAGEYLMLGLRTTRGISESEYHAIYPGGFGKIGDVLDHYARYGYVQKNDEYWSFTPQGFLVSNRIIGDVLEAQARQRVESSASWKKQAIELGDSRITDIAGRSGDTEWFRGM